MDLSLKYKVTVVPLFLFFKVCLALVISTNCLTHSVLFGKPQSSQSDLHSSTRQLFCDIDHDQDKLKHPHSRVFRFSLRWKHSCIAQGCRKWYVGMFYTYMKQRENGPQSAWLFHPAPKYPHSRCDWEMCTYSKASFQTYSETSSEDLCSPL